MSTFREPAGPPPSASTSAVPPRRHDPTLTDDTLEEAEPPPPYSTVADPGGQTLEANFARPYEVQDSGMFNQPSGPPPNQQQAHPPQSSSSTPSFGSTTQQQYPQPPLPPPRHPSVTRPQSSHPPIDPRNPPAHQDNMSSFSRPALPMQPPAHTLSPVNRPARYEPATSPTSGQPLLYRGKLLVYPTGFYCPKCHNTGFKAYDPNTPHVKCWDRYGKQYTQALRMAPDFSFSNPNLQRPLPNFRYTPTNVPPPQQHPMYYQAGHTPLQSLPPPQQMYHGPPGPQHYPGNQQYWHGGPPPNALVVQPGDPRIGGRLCYECGGDGQVAGGLFFLDTYTCRMCNGTGRVFF